MFPDGLNGVFAVAAWCRPSPGWRQIGRGQSILRGSSGRRLGRSRFRIAGFLWCGARERSGLMGTHRFAQRVVKHLRSRLRPVADRSRYLRADRARLRLARAETAQISDGRGCGRNCLGGADFAGRNVPLPGADRQQHKHQAEPKGNSQEKEHKARFPGGHYCRV